MSGFLSSSDLVIDNDQGESPEQAQRAQLDESPSSATSDQQAQQGLPGSFGQPGQPSSFDPRRLRTGLGMDVHAFAPGRPLIIGGVRIPHYQGLDGHSDADVLAHAVMDALLSAARAGDIGKLFPPSDPAFKNADSIELLERVSKKIRELGFEILDVDSVIAAQEPKISPYRDTMRERMADAMGVSVENVGIKATTTERLGYEGREEGITAYATCLLWRCSAE